MDNHAAGAYHTHIQGRCTPHGRASDAAGIVPRSCYNGSLRDRTSKQRYTRARPRNERDGGCHESTGLNPHAYFRRRHPPQQEHRDAPLQTTTRPPNESRPGRHVHHPQASTHSTRYHRPSSRGRESLHRHAIPPYASLGTAPRPRLLPTTILGDRIPSSIADPTEANPSAIATRAPRRDGSHGSRGTGGRTPRPGAFASYNTIPSSIATQNPRSPASPVSPHGFLPAYPYTSREYSAKITAS